jgi:transcriptional regulator with XRE-family HTH domain
LKKIAKKSPLSIFLRKHRLKNQLSQKQLAVLLKYESSQYISDWERGISSPPMKKLNHLAEVLQIPTDILFDLLLKYSLQKLTQEMSQEYAKLRKNA